MHPSLSCSLSTATHRLVCAANRRWLAVAAAAVVAAMPLSVALADSPQKQGGIIIHDDKQGGIIIHEDRDAGIIVHDDTQGGIIVHEDRDTGVVIQDRANSEFDNVEFIGTLTV